MQQRMQRNPDQNYQEDYCWSGMETAKNSASRWSRLRKLLSRPVLLSIIVAEAVFETFWVWSLQPHGCIDRSPFVKHLNTLGAGSYDYEQFWKNAREIAFSNNKSLHEKESWNNFPSQKPCPKVYVYDLPAELRDISRSEIQSVDQAFGEQVMIPGWRRLLRRTGQYDFGMILQHRLINSNCYYTDDPSQADLFFVPILTRKKKSSSWREVCQAINVTSTLLPALPYLTPNTAPRHFVVLPKGHTNGRTCSGWFYDPVPELENIVRLAYSHVDIPANESETKRHPNLISIPYPSSIHWTGKGIPRHWPWVNLRKRKRKSLMGFIGSPDHGDVPVRQLIQQMCESYADQELCAFGEFTFRELTEKYNSVFCLEPGGDTPWRKSLSDSLTFGCIPVLFSNLTDDVATWNWGAWKRQARVLIDREEFLSGHIDLYTLLSSIPEDLLSLMQETIERYARQFQYSLEDDVHDGIHVILTEMKDRAQIISGVGLY